jgi:predicted metal-dependent HD superfamily phosphohydrolase
MHKTRWLRLMSSLKLPAEEESFTALVGAYSEKHRHYHTVEHIDYCLRELDSAKDLASEPAEVEFALWFHDAIYDPYRSDNEQKSAELACSLLQRHCVDPERIARVRAHIMATRHEAPVTMPDSQLVVDIDLSILGSEEAVYAQFEENVREEYRWVPSIMFRRKRAEILESFLMRPYIYCTESFRTRYEAQAWRNLSYAISALRG